MINHLDAKCLLSVYSPTLSVPKCWCRGAQRTHFPASGERTTPTPSGEGNSPFPCRAGSGAEEGQKGISWDPSCPQIPSGRSFGWDSGGQWYSGTAGAVERRPCGESSSGVGAERGRKGGREEEEGLIKHKHCSD